MSRAMSYIRWICIFVGAVSLFSLLEKFINFGVAPHFNAMLGIYRSALYPLGEKLIGYSRSIFAAYHINVPAFPIEFVILYVLFSFVIAHFTYNQQESLKKQFGSIPVAFILLPLTLIWPLVMIGNIFAVCISPKLGASSILFGWDIEFAKVIGVCLALFGVNAYLLA
jgi:hypothetical protein